MTCETCHFFNVMLRTATGIGRGECEFVLPPWLPVPDKREGGREVYSGDTCSLWQLRAALAAEGREEA